ncbi:N-acyl-D-amino-acid deacylase family protein [Rufibacter latericius]|uniref:N-acyl-D-amino acid deacylase n=1 Tax=Rufibacter latericius TaxID=2487040 RepID=A0A3M9MAB0_9BACT|nr:amidohydrolase family protein [Rufibacter latericius]RNI22501.1 N-acyl-D-amino acid deacylase [Rufibacter latericius]
MRSFPLLVLVFLLCTLVACAQKEPSFKAFLQGQKNKQFDVLITGGQVVDGTGKKGYSADVLLRKDTVAYIGKVDTTLVKVKKVINATGKVVTPGFIDTHGHGDPMGKKGFQNFLAMGVTTVILGQDGSHPEDLKAWMQNLEQTPADVNVATFVGHGTLRMESGVKFDSLPSPEQLKKMGQLLRNQLDMGCLGLSTGLEYIPGLYAPTYELEYLAKVVGKKGKLITSHMRNEDNDGVEVSIEELLLQGKYCPVHVSHIKAVFGKGKERAEQILAKLEAARQSGIKVTADVYPYTASFTGISILYPEWALPPNNFAQVVSSRRQELETYLRDKVTKRNGPQATLIGTAPYSGKTLAQIAQEKNKPFEQVLVENLPPGTASAAYFVMDEALQARFITDSSTMICSDGGPDMRHPRGYGTFARIIEEYVIKTKQIPLEEAIRKMTSLSAKTMGLPDRGVLAVGRKADVLVFDPAKIHETTTYQNPFQLATGFDTILINGKISLEKGKITPQKNGELLRRK